MSRQDPTARRLQRLTQDPKYGPKLRQLPKREQRRITDLVTGNQGRQARKDIVAADQARREARNLRDRTRRRSRAESKALDNLRRQLPEASQRRLKRNVENMSYPNLKVAGEADRGELRARAQSGRRVMIDGEESNLFWYH